jgi:hypothetical protein
MNDVLEDAVFVEGNLPTGHRVSIRTGLPAVYFRQIGAACTDEQIHDCTGR